ncbi:MAG: response regulator [Halobacteriovoraceae bacterium]|nr:response regulator [Halobacteriovoraceae bacterium]
MSQKSEVYIAVVDDSDLSRKSIVEILEQAGYNVVGDAADGTKAVLLAQTTNANLFIIDVVMPEVSGIELMGLIKDHKKSAAYIMMSSLKMESIILESITGGALDFLIKPFSKDTLLRSVAKLAKQIEEGSLE